MIRDCLVIGQPNVGKTAFTLGFADYLGIKELQIEFTYPDGFNTVKTYPLNMAKEELISAQNHSTRVLQSLTITLKTRKTKHAVKLMDTTGLINGIHESQDIRLGMAQTLRALQKAYIVIHLFDANRIGALGFGRSIGQSTGQSIGLIDHQIARYMRLKGNYIICANKMDLPHSKNGLTLLQSSFPDARIISISAITKKGMSEVKKCVASFL